MAFSLLKFFFLLSSIILSSTYALNSSTTTLTPKTLNVITVFCKNKPYPEECLESLKLTISININPNILSFLLKTLQTAISEATKLTTVFSNTGNGNLVEKQRGTVQDCIQLHQITLSSLQRSVSKIRAGDSRKIADARAYLSAALTNKNTCLEGLDSASGPLKPLIMDSMIRTSKHVTNSLTMLPKPAAKKGHRNRRLLGFPPWISGNARRILESDNGDEYDPSEVLTVGSDGSGNFSTITEAINFAPNNSYDRVIIYIKEGVYEENVEIPSYKTNIVMLGDGSDVTLITGRRSVGDGWTTFRSATLAVSGEGFLARDITIENSAGPAKHQAVAVRINADLSAMYRCTINGYQDTLYTHSFRQFYRECDISGTIDYIFGNAAVVFQASNIISRMPMAGQFTVITAQSREIPEQDTGISLQNCSIVATDNLYSNSSAVKSYLGRPWKAYARTVVLESYVDGFINPSGWTAWSGENEGLDTLYYGEYNNYGPGSGTDDRVNWTGWHEMDYSDAYNFTVSSFITGDEWLDSTSFPYDDDI